MSSLTTIATRLILALSLTPVSGVLPVFAALASNTNGKAVSTVQKRAGAKPAQHLSGKLGEVLFDSQWRFQALSVQTPEAYAIKSDAEPYDYADVSRFDSTKRTLTPKSGYKLIVIECRATNAQKSQKRLWVAASDTSNVRTALLDTGGSSHVPIAYDFEGAPIQTKPLQAGETITFPLIFSVPQTVQLKELLFTLAANGERETSKDAHVLLAEGNGRSESTTRLDPPDFSARVNGFVNSVEYRRRFVQLSAEKPGEEPKGRTRGIIPSCRACL